MQLKITSTEWEFANEIAENTNPKKLSVGIHHLHIDDGSYNPDTKVMSIKLRSLDNPGEVEEFKYYLNKKDGTKNGMAIGILNTLKGALSGDSKGILLPCDFINGIVMAEVNLGKPYEASNGQTYQNNEIKKFEPIDVMYYAMASEVEEVIEQYVVE